MDSIRDGVQEKIDDKVDTFVGTHRIGVIGRGDVLWTWVTERIGTCVWSFDSVTNSEAALVLRLSHQPVNIVLFEEGVNPTRQHPVWTSTSVTLVVWLCGKSRFGPSASTDWKLRRVTMDHSSLGGVSDLKVWTSIAWRTGPSVSHVEDMNTLLTQTTPGLKSATMNGILQPATKGGISCKAPATVEEDARWLKIRWANHRSRFIVPSVYSATGFVRRQLSPLELATALDFPAAVYKTASDKALAAWVAGCRVPLKMRVEILRRLERFLKVDSHVPLTCLPMGPSVASVVASPMDSIDSGSVPAASHLPVVTDASRVLKATKSDNAAIPYHWWDDRVRRVLPWLDPVDEDSAETARREQRYQHAATTLRTALLCYWRRLVTREFLSWWKSESTARRQAGEPLCSRNLDAGRIAIWHACHASWWDWDPGSAPFFWRFPREWLVDLRDGIPPKWTGSPPQYRRRQPKQQDALTLALERKKFSTVRDRGYIGPQRHILSLTSFFSVPKGQDDIRMVYDGTKSGLNAVLFAPWFALSTVDTMLRSVDTCTWSADNDFGEMFLNFWLHPKLRLYTGIDLTDMFPEELRVRPGRLLVWESWTRCAMGLTTSPYQATQAAQRMKRLVLGDRTDPSNVFRWSVVRLNLPGDISYDPSLPPVQLLRDDGTFAAEVHPYVDDDLRETAPMEDEAWAAASQMAKGAAYFGTQDAARKRRQPKRAPGAWAGAVVETSAEGVFKLVSQDRWDKLLKHLTRLREMTLMELINRKELERIRGFLVYVSLTYTIITPYLKGIHLTLESWRPDRDAEGWRMTASAYARMRDDREGGVQLEEDSVNDKAPELVAQAPRFQADVTALEHICGTPHPPKVRVRPRRGALAALMFGDASGDGFGTSLWVYGSESVLTQHGTWTRAYGARSSNFRELYNLLLRVEELVETGGLQEGTQLFIFTDNSTAESAFYRGSSSSPLLFELVLRFRKLEMGGRLFLKVVWVAGTRMIEQGTDGLSRGDLLNGTMAGRGMLAYVPLNKSAEERSPGLSDFLISGDSTERGWRLLTPTGWFEDGLEQGNFVWMPPPAAAAVALDKLCEAKHIRPEGGHMFVCPALLTCEWRKRLGRLADVVFVVPVDSFLWPACQHEPVIIGLICPLLRCSPWQVKRDKSIVDHFVTRVQTLWASGPTSVREHLQQFWTHAWNLA